MARRTQAVIIHRLRRSPFPEGEGLAWFHSAAQVISGTWRAAGCRPYIEKCFVSFEIKRIYPYIVLKKCE